MLLTRHAEKGSKEARHDRSEPIGNHRFPCRIEITRSLRRFDTLDRSDRNRDGRGNRRRQVGTYAIHMGEHLSSRKGWCVSFDNLTGITYVLCLVQGCSPAKASAYNQSNNGHRKRTNLNWRLSIE